MHMKQKIGSQVFVAYVTAALSPAAGVIGQAREENYEAKRAAHLAYKRSFEYGGTYLADAPRTAFVDVDFNDLPRDLRSEMYNVLAAIIQQDARPQDPGKGCEPDRMTVRVFAAQDRKEDDLVEYTWVDKGQEIRVVASRDAARLDLDMDEAERNPELAGFGQERTERVKGLVESIVRLGGEAFSLSREPFEVQVPWPAALVDGLRFSTDAEQSIQAMDAVYWFKRIDFSVHHGTLSIMFYLKPGQLAGPQDGSKWFPDDFRALVLQRACELGKAPAESEPDRE